VLGVHYNVFLSQPQIQNEESSDRVDDILDVSFLSVPNSVVLNAIVGVEPVGILACI